MAKKKIRVHTAFNFNSQNGTSQRFEVGEHSVDASVAEHWFVVAHSDVTGSSKDDDGVADLQAQITSLTAQLEEKDKTISELQVADGEKDEQITSLTAQLAALQTPAKPAEETTDGTKPKSANSK